MKAANLLLPKINKEHIPPLLKVSLTGALIAGIYGIIHDSIILDKDIFREWNKPYMRAALLRSFGKNVRRNTLTFHVRRVEERLPHRRAALLPSNMKKIYLVLADRQT